jgi:hypothetical protein
MKYPPFSEATPELISQVSKQIQENDMSIEEVKKTFGWDIGDTKEVTDEDGYTYVDFDFDMVDINAVFITKQEAEQRLKELKGE